MNTTMQATKIKQSWTVTDMQAAATKMVSHKIASRINFLDKHHAKEIDQMEKASAHLNAEMLIRDGVKTPLDLAKHLAEYEVNMFGSEASISGDSECASLISEKSAVWLETKQANNLSEDQIKAMHDHYSSWMKHLGHRLGFKVHIELTEDGNSSTVTFRVK